MSFTQAELDAMRAADAEIEASFCMTPEEIASARRRDEWAVFERVCMIKPPKDRESGFRRFKAKKKRVYTPEQLRRQRENNKKWREAHKEYRRDYCREWYQGRRALILAKQKAYYEANREKRLAYGRGYREARREELRAKQAARYRRKKEEESQ